MSDTRKWIALIAKLLEHTQDDSIHWAMRETPQTLLPSSDVIDHVYESTYMEKGLRIYPFRYKHWMDEDRYEWSDGVRLEIIDEQGRTLFEVPSVEGLYDLLKAVQYQTAGIDQFLSAVTG